MWPLAQDKRAWHSYRLLRTQDQPAIWLNEEIMARWRPEMRPYYYDSSRFSSYLEQLGIEYPTIRSRPVSEEDTPQVGVPGGS